MNDREYSPQLAEELRLLVEMVAARAQPWLDEMISAGHDGQPTGHAGEPKGSAGDGSTGEWPTDATGEDGAEPRRQPSECTWCPLCAVVAMARGRRPELTARVLDHAAELVALLRAVLADRWDPGTVHMPGFRPGEGGAYPPEGEPAADRTDDGSGAHGAGEEPGARWAGGERRQDAGDGSARVQHIPVRKRGTTAGNVP